MTRRINMARWQPHVEEARRRGVSLYSLYRASQVLRQGGAVEPSTPDGKFAAVRVVTAPAAPAATLRVAAQLPNGVSLHVDARGQDVASVIAALGALPCSA